MKVEFPERLLRQFEDTSFCPDDLIRGRPEHGDAWSTLDVDFEPGSESEYPTSYMYYVLHHKGEVTRASRAFAEWTGRKDGQFVKAVIDWLQSMTQARNVSEEGEG